MVWQVRLPRAVQLVIDDVGWREGWSLAEQGGPWRAGLHRLLEPADYRALVDLGQQLGIRPTAALVLGEWDREDACARYPTTTPAGSAWTNATRRGDWSDEAARLFVEAAAHLELALHGVGHEHWEDGLRTRAEWLGEGGRVWPRATLAGHLECFAALLDQHHLGPAAGHRLPLSFVPCAFQYLLADDPEGTGALMTGAGVRLASTPFARLTRRRAPDRPDGTADHGLLLLDRGDNKVPWDAVATVPAAVLGEFADPGAATLAELAGAVERLSVETLELLLARRPADRAEDWAALRQSQAGALAELIRLYLGRGAGVEELLAAGRRALERALREFEPDRGTEFDAYVESCLREALQATVAAAPAGQAGAIPGAGVICGVHWPNLLAARPADNDRAIGRWVEYLGRVGAQPGQCLAANAAEAGAQWIWSTFGRVTGTADGFELDLTAVPAAYRALAAERPVILEIGGWRRVGRPLAGDLTPLWYQRRGERAFLAVKAPAGVGRLAFAEDQGPLQPIVYRDGTYDVLDLRELPDRLEIDLEVYGTQTVTVAPGFAPAEPAARGLDLLASRPNPTLGVLAVRLAGHDLQGQRGTLIIGRSRPG